MKALLTTACLLLLFGVVHAQTQQGTWEMSVSGTFGSSSSKSEASISGGQTSSHESDAINYASLALRPGYYIIDGLAIEPEVYWTAVKNDKPLFNLTANLSYNYRTPQSPAIPFLFIGYGVGNAIPLFQRLFLQSSDKMDISVLNIGAGLKYMISQHVAFRGEYRYQRYYQERDEKSSFSSATYTYKMTTTHHNFFFGFSVFLP